MSRCYSTGDKCGLSKVAVSLNRISLICGLAGMVLMISLSPWVSEFSLGSSEHFGLSSQFL